jgi:hypothetical protein
MPDSESSLRPAQEVLVRTCAWVGQVVARFWRMVFPRPLMRTYQERFHAEVPCQGDAFSFSVTIHELWSGPGKSNVVESAVEERIKVQHMAVERRLRIISRRFPSEAAEEFERAANTAFESPTHFPGELACSYSIHAAPDPGLHQHLRDAEIKRLEARVEDTREKQHLDHVEFMRDRWFAFLRKFDGDPLGSLAAQLAGAPDQLANVVAARTAERERLTDELRKLCDTTSEAYRDKDVFEFVTSTDSALSRLLRHVHIESPSRSDGGPASAGSEAVNGDRTPHI